MKEKLIKTVDGYELLRQGFLKGSTNHELIDSLNIEEGNIRYKLSINNCQAIERGYDLDELAKTIFPDKIFTTNEEYEIPIDGFPYQWGFKVGFQKALELMGDKKFSEKDINTAYSTGYEDGKRNENFWRKLIQSLQQTEWDVEIEMEKVPVKMPGVMVFTKAPKLDKDECLILKKITNEN